MADWSKGWIRIYHEVIIDDKMGLLSDHLWRRAIECMIAAGAEGRGGYLPDLRAFARKLVTSEADLEHDLADLAAPGIKIVEQRPDGWFVTNHAKRQTARDSTAAQRQATFRERQKAKYAALQSPLCNALRNPLYNGEEEKKIEEGLEVSPSPQNVNQVTAFSPPGYHVDTVSMPTITILRSNGAGRKHSERMTALNDKLGPELRRALADQILKITGQFELANTDGDAADAALYAAHEAAVTLYQMDCRTEQAIMTVEDAWYESDFRGKKGERPTIRQLVEQASKVKATPRAPTRVAAEVYA